MAYQHATPETSQADWPFCPDCGRQFRPREFWSGANYCRAAYLLPYIAAHPHLSAWELAQATGMPYSDVGRALFKAREWRAVEYDEEPRENGDGVRYRYRVTPDYQAIIARGLRCPATW